MLIVEPLYLLSVSQPRTTWKVLLGKISWCGHVILMCYMCYIKNQYGHSWTKLNRFDSISRDSLWCKLKWGSLPLRPIFLKKECEILKPQQAGLNSRQSRNREAHFFSRSISWEFAVLVRKCSKFYLLKHYVLQMKTCWTKLKFVMNGICHTSKIQSATQRLEKHECLGNYVRTRILLLGALVVYVVCT